MHLRVLLRHGQTPSEQLFMMKIESTGILVIEVRERLTKLLKLPMDDLMLKVHPGVNFDEVYEDSAKIMDDLNETKNIGVTVPIPICFVQFESKSISESSIYGSAEISVATLANKLRSRFNVTDDKDLRVSRVSSTDALSGRTILRPGDTSLEDPLVVEVIPTVRPIEWIEPRMMIPATIRLTFVNRDDATSKLLSVHSANYDRASTHEGSKFQCPICINDSGSGKSRFALEYQSSVRRLYPNDSSPAVSSLLSAVTVHMPLEEPVMTSWNEKLGSLIKAQVLQMVSNPSVIHGLSGDFIPLVTALIALGNRSVFLVIDDIERGFSRDDDLLSEEHHADELNLVVQNLIQPLMMNPRFFVLICGNAPFLLNSRMTLSPVAYTRISLNMLRPGYICTILDSTQMMGMMNLAEYLGVQEVLASYSSDLYELTGGHPRSLQTVLSERCRAKRFTPLEFELSGNRTPEEALLSPVDIDGLATMVGRFPRVGAKLLAACGESSLDLMETLHGLTLKDWLPAFRIGYEIGPTGIINLTIPRNIRFALESLVCPLAEFLRKVLHHTDIPPDYGETFEIVVRKRLCEIFKAPCIPRTVDGFFAHSAVFGNLNHFQCPEAYKSFPKVTLASNQLDPLGLTISSDRVSEVVGRLLLQQSESSCLYVPKRFSSSPDLFHLSEHMNQKRFVSFAIKNHGPFNPMGRSEVIQEVRKAERLVPRGNQFRNITCVLIVVSTNFSRDLIPGGRPTSVFAAGGGSILDEILLVDLTNPVRRSEFFNVTGDLATALERIVEKSVLPS